MSRHVLAVALVCMAGQVRTDGKGRALLEALPAGVVRVEVAMEGFVTARILNLRLARGCTAATAPLEIGGLGDPAAP